MILPEWTITDLNEKMESGELTSRQVTELYLQRIAAVDKGGPYINSVIELNPDALEIADGLDKERKAGKLRGALHGIPILIKDNIDTHDRMQTTAGSLALEGNIAAKDAFIVKQLRKAGAVILGKTNLSEWANFRGKRSISGWSSRGGLTRNPYALDRSTSGSSSGSGGMQPSQHVGWMMAFDWTAWGGVVGKSSDEHPATNKLAAMRHTFLVER